MNTFTSQILIPFFVLVLLLKLIEMAEDYSLEQKRKRKNAAVRMNHADHADVAAARANNRTIDGTCATA